MFSIKKASLEDVEALAFVCKKAFVIPHEKVIPKKIMDAYLKDNFNLKTLSKEITNKDFEYHLIYSNEVLAGFSKIIFNQQNQNIADKNVTKMERIYLLKEYYGLGLGKKLFDFNRNLAKKNNQNGMWLYVWIKNYRALDFYKKVGFKKIASYDFPISETETRINDVLFLEF